MGDRHTASYLQTCWKRGRTYGTANIGITHRVSDLVAQADDGAAVAKIAAGLLADSATKIIHRQAPDQHDHAVAAFGLTQPEAGVIGHVTRGRALWKLPNHTALVHHLLASGHETTLCDTCSHTATRLLFQLTPISRTCWSAAPASGVFGSSRLNRRIASRNR